MSSAASEESSRKTSAAERQPRSWSSGKALVLYIAISKFVFQMLVAGRYGYFADELYYLACSEHLALGYADHPPLVAGLMFVTRHIFGTSLLGIRVAPALAGAALVWLVGIIVRELGGGRFAQLLASICVVAAPVYMWLFHLFSMNSIESLIWTGCVYCCIAAVKRDNPRYWVAFGVLFGVGLENKYSVALFVASLLLGLLFTPARNVFRTMEFWLGMLLATLIYLPNFLWLWSHHFPFLQWQAASAQRDNVRNSIPQFLLQQVTLTGATVITWGTAVWFFLFDQHGRRYRFVGLAFIFAMITFVFLKGKPYYPVPIYAIGFAGGAVFIENLTKRCKWVRVTIVLLICITGAVLAPCFVPILALDRVVAYQSKLPVPLPIHWDAYATGMKMPQTFVFETGWQELVSAVSDVYNHLPPEDRVQADILTFNYATGGAIDLLGPKYGLPKSIGTHMSYHFWGPAQARGDVLILVGSVIGPEWCDRYERGAVLNNPYMYKNVDMNGPIVNVCYGLKFDLQQNWDKIP